MGVFGVQQSTSDSSVALSINSWRGKSALFTDIGNIWNWEPINNQGDDKGSHSRLRVEKGKFKGWYLAAEPESIEVKSVDGKRKFHARKLKFVEQAEDAMEFVVYVVSK